MGFFCIAISCEILRRGISRRFTVLSLAPPVWFVVRVGQEPDHFRLSFPPLAWWVVYFFFSYNTLYKCVTDHFQNHYTAAQRYHCVNSVLQYRHHEVRDNIVVHDHTIRALVISLGFHNERYIRGCSVQAQSKLQFFAQPLVSSLNDRLFDVPVLTGLDSRTCPSH